MEHQLTTTWIERLTAGESLAAQQVWEHFYERLIRLARRRMSAGPRRMADEEDIVVIAFNSFFRGIEARRFPQLADADDLWQILVMLTARKAIDQMQHDNRLKRGGGKVLGESIFLKGDSSQIGFDPEDPGEPTPEFALQMTEEIDAMMGALKDQSLQNVALAKLEGYSNQEVAERLGIGLRSVERKLKLVRAVWKDFVET